MGVGVKTKLNYVTVSRGYDARLEEAEISCDCGHPACSKQAPPGWSNKLA
jgi:hypothetical protein